MLIFFGKIKKNRQKLTFSLLATSIIEPTCFFQTTYSANNNVNDSKKDDCTFDYIKKQTIFA